MQKTIIVALCALGCVLAVDDKDATVVRSDYELSPEGGFHTAYETSNGINSQQDAVVKPSSINKDDVELVVTGQNSYTAPDGQTFSLTYVADANGYNPQGDHLPTPPAPEPIPDYIQRSLAYIAAHPYTEKQ